MQYDHLLLEIRDYTGYVTLNRPDKANAMHLPAWRELSAALEFLDQTPQVRVIVLSGSGKHFCSGIDVSFLMTVTTNADPDCEARSKEQLRKQIIALQAPINAIESCSKPVIASISGGCIGAGLDIVSACDLRYCSDDAFFSIREIDVGMVADLGTLQRLPKLVAPGLVREMAYTGRNVGSTEAESAGLVNRRYETREELTSAVDEVASAIASKSPLSIRGTKHILNHARDHSVGEGLGYVATWNAAMLVSEDLRRAFQAKINQSEPRFRN